MPSGLTSACISLGGALVGGVWLGYVVAPRTAGRKPWNAALWIWMVMSLAATRWSGIALVEAFAGLPLVALCACRAFERGHEQRKAARGLGASEWRIFWRVMLPIGWQGVSGGVVLALFRMALERALAPTL